MNRLPFGGNSFDFMYPVNTLHNLQFADQFRSLKEIERVASDGRAHIRVGSNRDKYGKVDQLY